MTESDVIDMALLSYSIFSALTCLRAALPLNNESVGYDLLEQRLVEGTRGHPKSSKFLNSKFTQ